MSTISGPRKFTSLDDTPEDDWRIEAGVVYAYKSRLWTPIDTGCVLCVEAERSDPKGQTLSDIHGVGHMCLTHGELESIPYKIQRDVTITFGHIERKGQQTIEDVVLIPLSMPSEEKVSLIERLISMADEDESSKGPLDD